jgi:hypothetical protein
MRDAMSDRILTQEIVETYRAGLGRMDQQRTKLEKIQRMRQTIEKLSLTERHSQVEAHDSD